MDSVKRTEAYYDSTDADLFYRTVWGGEDIHVGLYRRAEDTVRTASQATVEYMIRLLPELTRHSTVLDLGAGYGGAARHIVRQVGCSVTCLNVSAVENAYNRQRNAEEQLTEAIRVVHGNFEELPFGKNTFEVVWSEEAFLHSPHKEQILAEAWKVLKPGGVLLFTDPMQAPDCPPSVLQPILRRLDLDGLSTLAYYRQAAHKVGFGTTTFFELSQHLTRHYSAILNILRSQEVDLRQKGCSSTYLRNMAEGLQHWIEGGEKGWLRWGVFRMVKPG